ncbi:MAG: DHHW family protein [Clostridia bacterium]|nr:DHHW family protein [Clostridia bacterium]
MENRKQLFSRDNIGLMLLLVTMFILFIVFFLSIVIPDKEISERENRTLARFPKFTFATYFSGEFNSDIEEYFSDNFPFRDKLLNVNEKLTKLTSQFSAGGDDSIVVIETGERDLGGEGFGDYEKAQAESEATD